MTRHAMTLLQMYREIVSHVIRLLYCYFEKSSVPVTTDSV